MAAPTGASSPTMLLGIDPPCTLRASSVELRRPPAVPNGHQSKLPTNLGNQVSAGETSSYADPGSGQGRGRTADLPLFRCSGCPAHGGCARVRGCLRLRRAADGCRCCRHGCRLRYEWTFRLRGGESRWLAAAVIVAVTSAIRSAC